jgi:uncharacterized protein YecE (DUF72 family)
VLPQTLPRTIRERASAGEKSRLYLRHLPKDAVDALWALHVDALQPLAQADKLGALLFQFPPWFIPSAEHREYLAELSDRIPYPTAVEFRGGGWMADAQNQERTRALLERLGLAYVVVDEPQGFRSSTPAVVARTSELAIIRFHGRNVEAWEKKSLTAAQRFRYLYAKDELKPWVRTVQELAREGAVHALFNNCFEDYAVRNADDLVGLLASSA